MTQSVTAPDRAAVLTALNRVIDPVSGRGLSDAGLVRGLVVGAKSGFMLEVPASEARRYEAVRAEAERVLGGLAGVEKAQVVLTAEGEAAPRAPSAKLSPAATDQTRPSAPVPSARPAHVRRVIAVASGKGGVGKSTLSLNLALGLAAQGLKTGLLDADIYGPSLPVMTGLSGAPALDEHKNMIPKSAFGLKVNSIGFLTKPDDAMIWRGPMASQALTQLLTQTLWGQEGEALDVLVVDMPPGTGDVHLTFGQKTLIDGVVVVSTPQDMALSDARRAVTLYEKTGVPVLGIIENMAFFRAPDGSEHEIFGRGGARRMAETLNVPFLGEVPLEPSLRAATDAGLPLREGGIADTFKGLASRIAARLF